MRRFLVVSILIVAPVLGGGASARADAPDVGVAYVDTLTDRARNRPLPLKAYFPAEAAGALPVVIVSHGLALNPLANELAREAYAYLGRHLAAHGYVVLHVLHRDQGPRPVEVERPLDVRYLLDALSARRVELPGFRGELDLARIGHTGHSAGAYTSFALAGARVRLPARLGGAVTSFREPRLRAFAPISSRGSGTVGPRGGVSLEADAWRGITAPVLMLVGEAELAFDAFGQPRPPRWRLEPWQSLPPGDKFLAILPAAGHSDFDHRGRRPADPVRARTMAYVKEQVTRFFDVYLKGERDQLPALGRAGLPPGGLLERK